MIKVVLASTMVVLMGCSGSNGGGSDDGGFGAANQSCVGTPTSCAQLTSWGCNSDQNCINGAYCTGVSYDGLGCDFWGTSEGVCESAGCSWVATCTPSYSPATSCESVSTGACLSTIGCSLSAGGSSPSGQGADGGFDACGGSISGTWRLVTMWTPTDSFFAYTGCPNALVIDGELTISATNFHIADDEACGNGNQSLEGDANYTTSNGIVTLNDGTDPTEVFKYCVQGQYLTIVGADGPFMFVATQ